MTAKIATANRLLDGAVVYLGPEGGWVEAIGRARIATNANQESELEAQGREAVAARHVVEPYLIDVTLSDDGRPVPIGWRETIRANGPTVLDQSGPRAAQGAGHV